MIQWWVRPKSREIKNIWRIKRLVLDVGGDAASSGRTVQLRCVTNEACAPSHFVGRRCPTGPKSSQGPFPHWSLFVLHPQPSWLVQVPQQRGFSIPFLPSDPFHTSLTSPTNIAWFPTALGRFISIFPCQLIRVPPALCWTAALCALHTC